MDLDEIRQILDLMREHELAEFELEREHFKLRLRKNTGGSWTAGTAGLPAMQYAASAPSTGGTHAGAVSSGVLPAAPVLTAANEDVDFAVIKSPIVGTFYRAAEPGAKPFVDVGQTVKKGEVLCIIEAMKLMNEINAECDGEIVKIFVENGQAVQYGERLFAIKPA